MAKVLFVNPDEMAKATLIGGNVDIDKYIIYIENTQIRVIKPLLGAELYNKIISDIELSSLTGLYLEMFTDYIKTITLYESCADFVAVSPYTLANGGLFKNSPENTEVVSKSEVDALSERHSSTAQIYVNAFYDWIEINKDSIPEYNFTQTGMKPLKVNVNNGWYFSDEI